MKTLYLVRHAKSDWENGTILDIERPLNERGYSNANMMSKAFKSKFSNPDVIISSPAIRAMTTALIFSRNIGYNADLIQIKTNLYETNKNEYLTIVSKMDDQYDSMMLFAHNPTISDFADMLCQALPFEMSTCAIAGIKFEINSWQDLKGKKGELFLFDFPKKH